MAIQLAWKSQPKGFVLISDAISAVGLIDGRYRLGGQDVEVHEGIARIKNKGVLAGATVGMDSLLRNFCQMTGASLIDGVEAASEKPAKLLGMYPKKGSLKVGADADLVILDDAKRVVATYGSGKLFYSSSSS
jgi:N-acetylglucosamine-6-phosphate deacetylase